MTTLSLRIYICLALLLAARACGAQQQVPPRTLDAMQQTLAAVVDQLYVTNDRFWHHGEYERCIATLRLITEMNPQDTQAFDDAAWLMENQLRDDESEAFRLKGISLNPTDPDLYFDIGYFYYVHERYAEAIQKMETAVGMGSSTITRHSLAHAYESEGDIYDALGAWLQIEAMDDTTGGVPANQIDRILQGEPDVNLPQFLTKMREQRKAEQAAKKHAK